MVATKQVSNSAPLDICKEEATDISRPVAWNNDKGLAAKFVQQEAQKKAAELLAKAKQRKKKGDEQLAPTLAAPMVANNTPVQVKRLHVAWQKNSPHHGGAVHHHEATAYPSLAIDKVQSKPGNQAESSGKENLNLPAKGVTETKKALNTPVVLNSVNSLLTGENDRQFPSSFSESEAKPASVTASDQQLSPKVAQHSIPAVSLDSEMQSVRLTSETERVPDLSGAKGSSELLQTAKSEMSLVAFTPKVESSPELSGAKGSSELLQTAKSEMSLVAFTPKVESSPELSGAKGSSELLQTAKSEMSSVAFTPKVESSPELSSAKGDFQLSASSSDDISAAEKKSLSGDERPLVLVNQPIAVTGPSVTQYEELKSPSQKFTETSSEPAPTPSGAIGGLNPGGRTLSYTFTQWRNSPVVTFELSRTGELNATTNSMEVQQALLESRHWLASENQLHFHEEGRDGEHGGQQQSEQEDES